MFYLTNLGPFSSNSGLQVKARSHSNLPRRWLWIINDVQAFCAMRHPASRYIVRRQTQELVIHIYMHQSTAHPVPNACTQSYITRVVAHGRGMACIIDPLYCLGGYKAHNCMGELLAGNRSAVLPWHALRRRINISVDLFDFCRSVESLEELSNPFSLELWYTDSSWFLHENARRLPRLY